MVKSKRNVNAFQKAMLSNTKVIGNSESAAEELQKEHAGPDINPELLKAYEKLAKSVNIESKDLIEIALTHFLNLEDVWFTKK